MVCSHIAFTGLVAQTKESGSTSLLCLPGNSERITGRLHSILLEKPCMLFNCFYIFVLVSCGLGQLPSRAIARKFVETSLNRSRTLEEFIAVRIDILLAVAGGVVTIGAMVARGMAVATGRRWRSSIVRINTVRVTCAVVAIAVGVARTKISIHISAADVCASIRPI